MLVLICIKIQLNAFACIIVLVIPIHTDNYKIYASIYSNSSNLSITMQSYVTVLSKLTVRKEQRSWLHHY